ncbi:uncharacterized protein YoxC [Dysgonomonas sp. PFB1-18]|nr:uncharacterized protein YoxC [Dysgonomonas sp. PF1-14]MDH6339603.1 uncharacterized protein YoxC [Dysgonomonas sp. PF1-16]MDH6381254.1 uncharacterized protein YoxC [Dysgonomonas sp. PFB1-18]MDH6398466.1 uncharacterized protein YoxC [Dysgonomonas sp. PF1-23]
MWAIIISFSFLTLALLLVIIILLCYIKDVHKTVDGLYNELQNVKYGK